MIMYNKLSIHSGAYIMAAWLILSVPTSWLAAILISILVHELGHLLALRVCHVKIYSLSIGVNGMQILAEPMNKRKECLCAMAGPLVGLLLLFAAKRFPIVAVCSLVHSAFNLLPIAGLDGYRALACFLRGSMAEDISERLLHGIQLIIVSSVIIES